MNNNLQKEAQKSQAAETDARATALRGKAPPNKRRRVRGSAAAAAGSNRADVAKTAGDREAHIASLLEEAQAMNIDANQRPEVITTAFDEEGEAYFELFDMNDLVVLHPYDGDMDEHVLEEVRPSHVIMYEPDAAFIRRIEVYRSSIPIGTSEHTFCATRTR